MQFQHQQKQMSLEVAYVPLLNNADSPFLPVMDELEEGLPIVIARTTQQVDPTPLQWNWDGKLYWSAAYHELSDSVLAFMKDLIFQTRKIELSDYTLNHPALSEQEQEPYFVPTFSMPDAPVLIIEPGPLVLVQKKWLNLNAMSDPRLLKIHIYNLAQTLQSNGVASIQDKTRRRFA